MKRKIKDIHLFYRISDNGFKNKKKPTYITKYNCLKNALSVFDEDRVFFHIYVDNVIEETDKQIKELCKNRKNMDITYIDCKSGGFSFRIVYEEACKLCDNDLVYFLEDDYIHKDDALDVLIDAAEYGYTDYITLYDHSDKYDNNGIINGGSINPLCKNMGERTILFKTNNHHWKLTNSTTMTFAAFVDVLKKDKDIFWKHTDTGYPYDFEIFTELLNNGRLLSSPVPSISTHGEIAYLAPFVNWMSLAEKKNTCCVVIITHKESLFGDEEMSIKRCIDVCSEKRDVFIVLPDSISLDYYKNLSKKLKIKTVGHEWLSSYKFYNCFLCSDVLYSMFADYDYILIYQTDCWIYEDRLDDFINLGYDYYGAPWPHEGNTVGNGGFSLRKVSKMREMVKKYPPIHGLNEDLWFCQKHGSDMNICDLKTACNFSMETITKNYLDMIDVRPMGLHSKMVRRYWKEPEQVNWKQ